jgi:hypothetical protein
MSFGFDFGRLRSDSTGLSFVDRFTYLGGTVTRTYDSPSFEFATAAQAILLPQVNIAASTIPAFPTISASLSTTDRRITVTASGGSIQSTILVFVR